MTIGEPWPVAFKAALYKSRGLANVSFLSGGKRGQEKSEEESSKEGYQEEGSQEGS